MLSIKDTKKMETWSLVGTDQELERLKADLAKAGWKLKYQGHSGSWLGEPVYEIRNTKKETNE